MHVEETKLTNTVIQFFSNSLVLYGFLSCLVLGAAGLLNLKTSANYRVYFDPDADIMALDARFSERYQVSDGLLISISSQDSLMVDSNWIAIENFILNLNSLDEVRGINSYIDLSRLTGTAPTSDDFDAGDYDNNEVDEVGLADDLEGQARLGKISADIRLTELLKHPRANRLISEDGQTVLIDINVVLGNKNSAVEVLNFMQSIEDEINTFKLSSGFVNAVHIGGIQALNGAYIDVVRHDLKRFIPLLLLVFGIGLFYFFRSFQIVLSVLLVGFVSTFGAFGMAGWAGQDLAAINAFSPVIIVSLSIATCVHLLTSSMRYLSQSMSLDDAIYKSLSTNLLPVFLSSVTTIGCFLFLVLSPSPPVRNVGYIVALGIIISFLSSYILLPRLIRLALARKVDQGPEVFLQLVTRWDLSGIGRRCFKWATPLSIAIIVVLLLGLFSLSRLSVNDDVYDYFPADHPFKQANNLFMSKFRGVSRVYYSVDSGSKLGIFDSEYLNFVGAFSAWLRQQEDVALVNNTQVLFESQKLNLLQLKSLANEGRLNNLALSSETSDDFRHTKISVTLRTTSTKEVLAIEEKSQHWLSQHSQKFIVEGGVSADLIFAQLGERNTRSLIYSLIGALILVALIVGLLFRSGSFMVMALICNVSPLIVVYGLWVHLGGFLSLGSSVVLGMIMGILIDDTLHMLIQYHRYVQSGSKEPVMRLYKTVAPAVFITSLTLIAGLLIGLVSQFRPIVELSGLSALIIFVALFFDLTLLPLLMSRFYYRRRAN